MVVWLKAESAPFELSFPAGDEVIEFCILIENTMGTSQALAYDNWE